MQTDKTLPLPKDDIKKLAAHGLSKSCIAKALGINKKHFDHALRKDAVFSRLLDRLVMDHYLQAEDSIINGSLDPSLYIHWTTTKWQKFYPKEYQRTWLKGCK